MVKGRDTISDISPQLQAFLITKHKSEVGRKEGKGGGLGGLVVLPDTTEKEGAFDHSKDVE